ncbi:hypothetical protein [Halonatronum saccharophilum]|nr:hypothetical protein [Halonatronum saccharophilum]
MEEICLRRVKKLRSFQQSVDCGSYRINSLALFLLTSLVAYGIF